MLLSSSIILNPTNSLIRIHVINCQVKLANESVAALATSGITWSSVVLWLFCLLVWPKHVHQGLLFEIAWNLFRIFWSNHYFFQLTECIIFGVTSPYIGQIDITDLHNGPVVVLHSWCCFSRVLTLDMTLSNVWVHSCHVLRVLFREAPDIDEAVNYLMPSPIHLLVD